MKSALITGASTGIGTEISLQLASKGYQVFLLARSQDKLESLSKEIQNSHWLPCDVSDKSQVVTAANALRDQLGEGLDVLVNNAGIFAYGTFEEQSEEAWHQQFQVNFFGALNVTKACLPLLKKKSKSSIVNISSNLSTQPIPGSSLYSATKSAINTWSMTLAGELAKDGVRVNCVLPGLVETPIHPWFGKDDEESKKAREWANNISPLGRMGQPSDIAQAVLYLVESEWVTGTNLTVDGGSNLLDS